MSMTKDGISDYILALVKPISPSASCTFASDDLGTLFTLQVPDTEKGMLIGKNGETVLAIRRIVSLVGFSSNIRASLKII